MRETSSSGCRSSLVGTKRSPSRVTPERVRAALTKPGRASTVRWSGFGERDGEEHATNRRVTPP